MVLTEKAIYNLHKKYSKGIKEKELLELIWTHGKIVEEIAQLVADNLEKKWDIKTNRKLIKQGALIHDIGSYACYGAVRKNVPAYIRHGEVGYEILINEGLPKNLARFALVHLGVGMVKENVEKNLLPLDKVDNIPITVEEEIVAYADNFHSKAGPRFVDFENAKNNLKKHYEPSEIMFERFEKKYGRPDLNIIIKKYNNWHIDMKKVVDEFKC